MTKPYEPTPADYRQIFEDHKVGAAILEQLTRIFARAAVVQGGIDAVLQTYHRDGSRRVVEFIVAQINRANGLPEADDNNPAA
ncbi:Bbp19 family protein [Herbaspirillum seropedicae]|uniref:Bbp19 family protein n=1 Tax=Herbaspirillum seropedicae TaxID=964 RepID=UPI003FCC812B